MKLISNTIQYLGFLDVFLRFLKFFAKLKKKKMLKKIPVCGLHFGAIAKLAVK